MNNNTLVDCILLGIISLIIDLFNLSHDFGTCFFFFLLFCANLLLIYSLGLMLMFSRNTLDTCSVAALDYCTIFYPRLALHSLHADRASGIKKYIYICIYILWEINRLRGVFYFSYYLFYRTRYSLRGRGPVACRRRFELASRLRLTEIPENGSRCRRRDVVADAAQSTEPKTESNQTEGGSQQVCSSVTK